MAPWLILNIPRRARGEQAPSVYDDNEPFRIILWLWMVFLMVVGVVAVVVMVAWLT